MNLSKPMKLLVGAGTFLPMFFIIVVSIFFVAIIASADHWGKEPPSELWIFFAVVIPLYFVVLITFIGLMVFYVFHIVKNITLSEGYKIMWLLLLFFVSFIAIPVYWIICVWPEPKEENGESVSVNTQ